MATRKTPIVIGTPSSAMAVRKALAASANDCWDFSWQITPRALLLRANSNPDKATAKQTVEAVTTMR